MSESVEFWLNRMKPTSRDTVRRSLNLFLKWMKENGGAFKDYSPDQIVEYQRNADNGHRYEILNLIQRYILVLNARKATKKSRYAFIRSFFMHNRADLPLDRSFKLPGDESKIRSNLTVEEARKVILSSDSMYQAVFLAMFQGGLGSHELLYWSNNGLAQLEEDLKRNPSIIRIGLPGRKANENKRDFYTFIGGDALSALMKWMTERPIDAKTIFVSDRKSPLNYFALQSYWRRKLRRLGIGPQHCGKRNGDRKNGEKLTRTGKSPHELKDLFRSQWAKSLAKAEVAEFCMGHMIDPLEYNKAWHDEKFHREEYVKALPYLEILSSGKPFHQVDEEEIESLRNEVERLRSGRNDDKEDLINQIKSLSDRLEDQNKTIASLIKNFQKQYEIVERLRKIAFYTEGR